MKIVRKEVVVQFDDRGFPVVKTVVETTKGSPEEKESADYTEAVGFHVDQYDPEIEGEQA